MTNSLISTVRKDVEPEIDPVGQAIAEQVSPQATKSARELNCKARKSDRIKKKPAGIYSLASLEKVNDLEFFDPSSLLENSSQYMNSVIDRAQVGIYIYPANTIR